MPIAKPFIFLLHQIWDSASLLPALKTENLPVLFLSGAQDELVPPSHMRELYRIVGSQTESSDGGSEEQEKGKISVKGKGRVRKVWKEFPEGTHNDTCVQPHYFETIASFIRSEILHKPLLPTSSSSVDVSHVEENLERQGVEAGSRVG